MFPLTLRRDSAEGMEGVHVVVTYTTIFLANTVAVLLLILTSRNCQHVPRGHKTQNNVTRRNTDTK